VPPVIDRRLNETGVIGGVGKRAGFCVVRDTLWFGCGSTPAAIAGRKPFAVGGMESATTGRGFMELGIRVAAFWIWKIALISIP